MKKISAREMCRIGIFTAITAVCAQLIVPMPYGVPMTMQTFAILLAGVALGAKNGALSALVYVLLGAAGAPVFAGFTGGLGVIFGRTGGFILSFPIMALAAGFGGAKSNKLWLAFWLIAGTAINFLCGMLMFGLVTGTGPAASFVYVVLPFIPGGIVKIILVALSGRVIKAALAKSGMPAP